ncbi:hypothetical protein GYMLUDRAFT_173865 [Collybiopsis luxurians FD-317 M1]|uniref:Uncharacterized protein n=1 Tax=Collybiopsis luxurians FD-317 M1 TaxID=944289 RepID=A0A0D0BNZ7_9AGAR|nr:hypothetical protein GYMLUDRAFT_173865 [Collybiopsis luxurians FD-317 M1]
MTTVLQSWHNNQDFFLTSGIWVDFNIPKFHSLLHYTLSIWLCGTTDNYNMEMFKHLHIDFSKEGWQVSNKRDHFPQMVTLLSRKEKIESFIFFMQWTSDTTLGSEPEDVAVEVDDPAIVVDKNNDDKGVTAKGIVCKDAMEVDEGADLFKNVIQLAKHALEPKKSLA